RRESKSPTRDPSCTGTPPWTENPKSSRAPGEPWFATKTPRLPLELTRKCSTNPATGCRNGSLSLTVWAALPSAKNELTRNANGAQRGDKSMVGLRPGKRRIHDSARGPPRSFEVGGTHALLGGRELLPSSSALRRLRLRLCCELIAGQIRRRAVHRRQRNVAHAQVDRELPAVVDQVVHHEAAHAGGPRQGEHRLPVLLERPRDREVDVGGGRERGAGRARGLVEHLQ